MVSDLFFQINFIVAIISSFIGLIFSITTIFIILYHRRCYSVFNLLTCNTAFIVGLYLVFSLISSIYGLKHDWAINQPACIFRAYIFVACCTLLLYSHVTHAVSRLFFVVFFHNRLLLGWRTHWIMIILNWDLGLILPLAPLFMYGGYVYEKESRLCTSTTKTLSTSVYGIITAFIIPFNTVATIYGFLVYRAHRSSRRVHIVTTNESIAGPNMNREMILVRNMSILLSIMLGGGIPYLSLVIWHEVLSQTIPEFMYLLIINSIHICTSLMMITLFSLNHKVKAITIEYFLRLRQAIIGNLIVQPTPIQLPVLTRTTLFKR